MEDGVSKYARTLAVWCVVVSAFNFVLAERIYGLEESTGPNGSNCIAVHQLGDTGEGVDVGLILQGNVRTTHEAFKDVNGVTHAFNYDFSGSGIGIIAHDTQLAGIIASRGGVANPNDVGVALGANIHCARVVDDSSTLNWSELENALQSLITTNNCRVIVTGLELVGSSDANGDNIWAMLYDYYAYQYGVIFTNAAGNENTYVAIFGDAYNGITTGGLRLNDPNNQFEYRRVGLVSGSGPTTDGRRKPEMTAPSQYQTVPTSTSDTAWTSVGSIYAETSWAVPHAAGAAALLLGLADTTVGPNDNNSAVIKAVLANSAMPNVLNKAGVSTNPANSNNTWQKDRGYGRLDVLRAYEVLDTNEVEPETTITQNRGWGLGRIGQGTTDIYAIHIPVRCRLIAATTWLRRIQWVDKKTGFPPRGDGVVQPDELTGYLANLDMAVYSPFDSNPIFNRAMFSYDSNDNLIKCDLLILTPGDYTIEISNNSTTSETANYGFAFELHPIMPSDLPPVDYIISYSDLFTFAQNWLVEGTYIDTLLSSNGIIDFSDFAILAQDWLQIDPLYYQY
jgi:hypothetical protein